MGKELADAFPAARDVFQEVDDALSQKLSKLMWEGPEGDLLLTENAQPAIMAASIAVVRILEKEMGLDVAKHAYLVAGHSLGEYSALCAAGAFTLADTARLLKTRGQAMQSAVPVGEGGMTALIGADIEQAEDVAKEAAAAGGVCVVANDNAPGQVVISGTLDALARAARHRQGQRHQARLAAGGLRAVPLPADAAGRRQAWPKRWPRSPSARWSVPVLANVTAKEANNPDHVRQLLVEQVTGRVRWRESILALQGPGRGHHGGIRRQQGSDRHGQAHRSRNLPDDHPRYARRPRSLSERVSDVRPHR